MMLDLKTLVDQAESRIRTHVRNTYLEMSDVLSELAECKVFLKLENLQHTGSFKVRGALNKLLSLSEEEKEKGIVTASSGNHALAVAHGLKQLKLPGAIYLPEHASVAKLKMLKRYDVEIKLCPGDCTDAETLARQQSLEQKLTYISPYNDPQVIGGQGTIGFELFQTDPSIDCVFVAVGGGGLIAGIAGYLKAVKPDVQIIGCLPQNSPAMFEAVKAKKIVECPVLDTLSDGTAGGIEADAITFEPCLRLVDDWLVVSEEEMAKGMKVIFEEHRLVIEGAAGVAVAAFLQKAPEFKGKRVALILCGGNIDMHIFKNVAC